MADQMVCFVSDGPGVYCLLDQKSPTLQATGLIFFYPLFSMIIFTSGTTLYISRGSILHLTFLPGIDSAHFITIPTWYQLGINLSRISMWQLFGQLMVTFYLLMCFLHRRLHQYLNMGSFMATHSSILAWRISGTEEPGGLLSMGLHRVGHD